MDRLTEYFDQIKGLIVVYGGRVVLAIVVLFIGLWIIKWIVKLASKAMHNRDVNESLRPFLTSIISILLRIMLVISVAGMIGIQVTAFIAVLGAAGLAIGLALQGSLANFAGGVLILLLKPFKVGDFIDTGSHSGTIREIQIFYTYMTTTQNQEVIIPNGELSNNALKNYSFYDTRRLDITFGIGYNDDIDLAKSILDNLVKEDSRFLTDPAHDVFVKDLADSSVIIHLRAWLKSSDYWDVTNNLNEKVKKAFDAENVSIPFPQRDIHMIKE
ncbi:mechanosensitive ion channel [Cryomorpha ignava]|uniref:Mechanosensitive ion channel n=1 Tax=Cryomorpha ignava TaxID=101383 RepID=A0A7K3WLV0_9FLAO|nr:mechanosensitive ion channel domain-containing protein [Cryomorpha ignava]NEN22488.1 mechanosensitive ion channel [Cryomorpha ignava]